VRLRGGLLVSVVVLSSLGAAVAIIPTIASSETSPSVEAVNSTGIYNEQHHSWSPPQVTVSAGGIVAMSNPTEVDHGVEWVSGPEKPACGAGVPVGDTPAAAGTKWSGTCTFAKAGTYVFYCTVHGSEMTGTVTVAADGTTTTTMPTMPTPTAPTPPAPGTPGEAGSEPPSDSLLEGSPAQALELAASQHGRSVHGSVKISKLGAGGRLEVELLAAGASLGKAKHRSPVRVGRLSRFSLQAGVVSFAVPLTAKAKAALHRHRRLALTVRIVLAPVHGAAVTITRSVVEHA
jgi:plastocyanin